MKIIKISRDDIHKFVASKYTKADGDQVVWFIGKENDKEGYCIFSACGKTEEVKIWLDDLMQKVSKDIRSSQ